MRLSSMHAILALAVLAACTDTAPTDVVAPDAAFAKATVGLAPTIDPATGHAYLAFEQPAVTWDEANAAATALKYRGCTGHLATITSMDENDFITGAFPAAAPGGYWLGGAQPPGWGEPDGGWGWVTGEPFYFTHWNGGEPNNSGPTFDEDRIHFAGPFTAPANATFWNDENHANLTGAISGYVVEFDCNATGPVVERVSGSGHFMYPQVDGAWRTFSFTARRYADGSVRGEYQLHNRLAGAKTHGEVTCFEAQDGQIWLGGFETNGPYADTPSHEVGWVVADNGEGSAAPSDQISLQSVGMPLGSASAYCTYKPVPILFDVVSGNIQVGH